jgi:hypothetical protein
MTKLLDGRLTVLPSPGWRANLVRDERAERLGCPCPQAVAFEPNPFNMMRLCESIALNEFHSQITLNMKVRKRCDLSLSGLSVCMP